MLFKDDIDTEKKEKETKKRRRKNPVSIRKKGKTVAITLSVKSLFLNNLKWLRNMDKKKKEGEGGKRKRRK